MQFLNLCERFEKNARCVSLYCVTIPTATTPICTGTITSSFDFYSRLSSATIPIFTGISQPLFTQWKQRKQSPSTENINKIAKHFNVSADYLLGNEEPTKVIDDVIKFAMFGTTDVTDEEFEDVKRYAQFIKDRKKNKSK